jgi:anthranilate phosphoribosyltransferase
MKFAVPVRRDMGIRTIFNVLGPLTNPAGARRQLVGVFDPALTKVMAEVLKELGSEHAMVVHGEGGIDELSTVGSSYVSELKTGEVKSYKLRIEDFGMQRTHPSELRGGDSKRNAEIINGILDGRKGPARDIAVLNAAAAVYVSGIASDLADGIAKAETAIDTGSAAVKLQQWIKESNNLGAS